MKKIILIAAVILASLFIFSPKKSVTPAVSTPTVSVMIDVNSTVATTSGITAHTAFEALTQAAKQQHLELKTKQYDFGVFVEKIGDNANTKDKSWIYFVNGKAGTVAADKQPVNIGDRVEWKYMTPTSE